MQAELDALDLGTNVSIQRVNGAGLESGNAAMCQDRQLPWLRDRVDSDVWSAWHVTYRDVVILDQDNHFLRAYNLTIHDLGDPAAYAALKQILLNAAP